MTPTLEHIAGPQPCTISQIETFAARHDAECAKLERMIGDLEADLEAAKLKHLRGLKRQASVVAARQAELHSAVEQSPALFVKPRTLTLHGTKLGFTSSEGRVEWNNDEQVVQLVEKHFPKRFDELVKTGFTPKKEALRDLAADELAKLGCRIEGAGDTVLVKRVAGDVEKLINKLIEKPARAMVGKD
jgi:hypothetical protein